jgi:DNA polymerase III epsilon subunit-like protein
MPKNKKPPARKEIKATPSAMAILADKHKIQRCPEEVFDLFATSDMYGRDYKNSRDIGHVWVKKNPSGEWVATQYAVKQSADLENARVHQFTGIQQVEMRGKTYLRAKDEKGKKFISKRSLGFQVGDKEPSDLHYLSPYDYSSSDADEFSSDDEASTEILRPDLTDEQRDTLAQIPHVTKSGTMLLNAKDVRTRDGIPRNTDQNEVMGQSAIDAYSDLLKNWKDYLSPKLILILKRAIEAKLFASPEKEFRPEWLHRIAHSLSLISDKEEDNPQQKSNLGSAGACANTEMMILERIAKWFSLSEETATVTLTSLFEMLLGTEVIRKIHFEVTVAMKDQFIRLIQDIDVFKEYPAFLKTSDLAQTVAIIDAIFNNEAPISTEKVEVILKKHQAQTSQLASTSSGVTQLAEEPDEAESEDVMKALHILSSHPEYKVCRHIQDQFPIIIPKEPFYIITILDLETTGLDASQDKIIEIAMRCVAVSKATRRVLGVVDTYAGLNEPTTPISANITRITHLTNEQLKGQTIDWARVHEIFSKTKYAVCHNTEFDHGFLKQQTPEDIQQQVSTMLFACTLKDINWYARGYDPRKLDYLNFNLGYFYGAHRALIDCDAVLNLLLNVPGARDELLYNAHKRYMYFFSNRLLGHQSVASMPKTGEIQTHEKVPTQSEIDNAYALLSTLPQYKIYQAVPQPLPIASPFGTNTTHHDHY